MEIRAEIGDYVEFDHDTVDEDARILLPGNPPVKFTAGERVRVTGYRGRDDCFLEIISDGGHRACFSRSLFTPVLQEWRCFHCNEVFKDHTSAQEHFGLDEMELPACVQVLTEGEKALVNGRREAQERVREAEEDVERHHGKLWDYMEVVRRINGSYDSSPTDARHKYEELEGRALAAEAALAMLPKWLARWARKEHERRWQRSRKRTEKFLAEARSYSARSDT